MSARSSRAWLPILGRYVQSHPAVLDWAAEGQAAGWDAFAASACGAVTPTPNWPPGSASGSRLSTAPRGRRGPSRSCPVLDRGDADDPDEGVRHPRRQPAADRPRRRRHPLLFRAAQAPRHERAVIADPLGRLLWASPALPGSAHDPTAARQHGIIEALAEAGLRCRADKAYQGAGGSVRVPFRGRRLKR